MAVLLDFTQWLKSQLEVLAHGDTLVVPVETKGARLVDLAIEHGGQSLRPSVRYRASLPFVDWSDGPPQVVLVDDSTATGHALLRAEDEIRDFGSMEVAKLSCVVDRSRLVSHRSERETSRLRAIRAMIDASTTSAYEAEVDRLAQLLVTSTPSPFIDHHAVDFYMEPGRTFEALEQLGRIASSDGAVSRLSVAEDRRATFLTIDYSHVADVFFARDLALRPGVAKIRLLADDRTGRCEAVPMAYSALAIDSPSGRRTDRRKTCLAAITHSPDTSRTTKSIATLLFGRASERAEPMMLMARSISAAAEFELLRKLTAAVAAADVNVSEPPRPIDEFGRLYGDEVGRLVASLLNEALAEPGGAITNTGKIGEASPSSRLAYEWSDPAVARARAVVQQLKGAPRGSSASFAELSEMVSDLGGHTSDMSESLDLALSFFGLNPRFETWQDRGELGRYHADRQYAVSSERTGDAERRRAQRVLGYVIHALETFDSPIKQDGGISHYTANKIGAILEPLFVDKKIPIRTIEDTHGATIGFALDGPGSPVVDRAILRKDNRYFVTEGRRLRSTEMSRPSVPGPSRAEQAESELRQLIEDRVQAVLRLVEAPEGPSVADRLLVLGMLPRENLGLDFAAYDLEAPLSTISELIGQGLSGKKYKLANMDSSYAKALSTVGESRKKLALLDNSEEWVRKAKQAVHPARQADQATFATLSTPPSDHHHIRFMSSWAKALEEGLADSKEWLVANAAAGFDNAMLIGFPTEGLSQLLRCGFVREEASVHARANSQPAAAADVFTDILDSAAITAFAFSGRSNTVRYENTAPRPLPRSVQREFAVLALDIRGGSQLTLDMKDTCAWTMRNWVKALGGVEIVLRQGDGGLFAFDEVSNAVLCAALVQSALELRALSGTGFQCEGIRAVVDRSVLRFNEREECDGTGADRATKLCDHAEFRYRNDVPDYVWLTPSAQATAAEFGSSGQNQTMPTVEVQYGGGPLPLSGIATTDVLSISSRQLRPSN